MPGRKTEPFPSAQFNGFCSDRPTNLDKLDHVDATFPVQNTILNQANNVIGIVPVPGIRSELEGLLLRYAQA
jgi:hypothetical protein